MRFFFFLNRTINFEQTVSSAKTIVIIVQTQLVNSFISIIGFVSDFQNIQPVLTNGHGTKSNPCREADPSKDSPVSNEGHLFYINLTH